MTRLLLVLGLASFGAGMTLGIASADDELAAPLAEAGRLIAQHRPHERDGMFLGCRRSATECAEAARREGGRMTLFHPHPLVCKSPDTLCCVGVRK